jgi:group I intron endonuclease
MSTASIYKFTNKINNKIYIGFTMNLKDRKKHHKFSAKNGNKQIFYNAIRKYGWKNFTVDVIYCSKERDYTLNVMEEYFIRLYNSHYQDGYGYNMTYGGEGCFGYKHDAIGLQKMSIGHKNQNNRKGAKLTKEQIKKHADKISCMWKIITPNNEEIIIKNLNRYCRENNFNAGHLVQVSKGKKNNYKNYHCFKIGEKNAISI